MHESPDAVYALPARGRILLYALTLPLVRRTVRGNVATLTRLFGRDLDGDFSLWDLAILFRGATSGPEVLLAGLVAALVAAVPLLRPLTQLVLLLSLRLGATGPTAHGGVRRWQRALHRWSRYLSYYWALEVAVAMIPMLQIGSGLIPHTVFNPITTPICSALHALLGDETCFTIEVERLAGFYVALGVVLLHALTGFNGSPTHRYIHSRIVRRG